MPSLAPGIPSAAGPRLRCAKRRALLSGILLSGTAAENGKAHKKHVPALKKIPANFWPAP
jgi:hypothetical protein